MEASLTREDNFFGQMSARISLTIFLVGKILKSLFGYLSGFLDGLHLEYIQVDHLVLLEQWHGGFDGWKK